MKMLKPNGQRAKRAITLIWIVLILEVINLISSYFQYDLLQRFVHGETVSQTEIILNDLREMIAGIFYFIAFIISTVTFIQWFRRAYYNLHQRVNNLLQSEGWAAGSWFVPLISLFRPYQIMKELYEESTDLLENKGHQVSNLSIRTVSWWWGLWIASSIFGNFIFRYTLKADTPDEFIFGTAASMIQNVINIPLALLAIKVIKDYARIEPLLFDLKEEEAQADETVNVLSE